MALTTHQGPAYFVEAPRTVTPHLYLQREAGKGVPELIEFLEAAFGAQVELRHDAPDGLVVHAIVRLEGSAIEIGEGRGSGLPGPAMFYVYVPDCDALYQRAIAAGGRPIHPPVDRQYGDRVAGVADAWGNEWFIATHLGGR